MFGLTFFSPPSESAPSNPYLVLFALWLMVFSSSSQVIIISPILPDISVELGIAEARLGTLVTAYALMLGVFALITGPISDKFGRRLILLWGCMAMSIALFFHGIVHTYYGLLIVRGVAGAAGGMLSGAAVSYVGDYFPYERRGWANGWVMSGIAFGQIIGIPIGKLLAGGFSFRYPFLVFAVTMALAVGLIWRYVPQPHVERSADRLSLPGALRGYVTLLRSGPNVAAAASFFLMFFSIGFYIVYLPTWLEIHLGFLNRDIALLFFLGGVVNVLAGPLAGQVSDKVGRKPLILTSCIGLSLLMVATTYVLVATWIAYVLFGLVMFMFALRISPLQSLVTALVPARRRGVLMSLTVAIGQIGIGVGGGLAGMFYARYGYVSNTWIGAVFILLMAWVVKYYLPEPGRTEPTFPEENGATGGPTEGNGGRDAAPLRTAATREK